LHESTESDLELDSANYTVAFLIMDGVFNTELTGPFDIFYHTMFRDSIKPMNVFTVAKTKKSITSFEGLVILTDYLLQIRYSNKEKKGFPLSNKSLLQKIFCLLLIMNARFNETK
tara:strand:- start:20027 stop:20371 length:345 start_codon:yes stop_codon:yes gene_type:complete